jgi:PBP1b-binding outer membrane lipoprotein LpoB
MRKYTFITLLIALALILAGCASCEKQPAESLSPSTS